MTTSHTLVKSNLNIKNKIRIKVLYFNNLNNNQNLGTLSALLELLIQQMSQSFEFMEN